RPTGRGRKDVSRIPWPEPADLLQRGIVQQRFQTTFPDVHGPGHSGGHSTFGPSKRQKVKPFWHRLRKRGQYVCGRFLEGPGLVNELRFGAGLVGMVPSNTSKDPGHDNTD